LSRRYHDRERKVRSSDGSKDNVPKELITYYNEVLLTHVYHL